MTQLRQHLQAARGEYLRQGYPGDLAAEVMPRTNWRRWALVSGAFGAGSIAAAAVIVLGLSHMAPRDAQDLPAQGIVSAAADQHLPALPPLPDFPRRLTREIPSYEKFLPPALLELKRHLWTHDSPPAAEPSKPA